MTIAKAIEELNELKEKHGENAEIAMIYFSDDDVEMICEQEDIDSCLIQSYISTIFDDLETGLSGEGMAVLSDLITAFSGKAE